MPKDDHDTLPPTIDDHYDYQVRDNRVVCNDEAVHTREAAPGAEAASAPQSDRGAEPPVGGQRKKHSGVSCLGVLLILGAALAMIYSEYRYVDNAVVLAEAQAVVVEMPNHQTIDPTFDGKLVHTIGTADTADNFLDPFGFRIHALKVMRKVQYYQTRESSTTDSDGDAVYSYDNGWANHPIDSQRFYSQLYRDDNFVITEIPEADWSAPNIFFGAYTLPEFLSFYIQEWTPAEIKLSDAQLLALHRKFFPKDALPDLTDDEASDDEDED